MSPSTEAREALAFFDRQLPSPEERQTPEYRALKAAAEAEALLDPKVLISRAETLERSAAQPDSAFFAGEGWAGPDVVRASFLEKAAALRARAAELTAQNEADTAVAPLPRKHRVAA